MLLAAKLYRLVKMVNGANHNVFGGGKNALRTHHNGSALESVNGSNTDKIGAESVRTFFNFRCKISVHIDVLSYVKQIVDLSIAHGNEKSNHFFEQKGGLFGQSMI
jgi:hypothetical protein